MVQIKERYCKDYQQQHNNKHETTTAAVIDNNSSSSSYWPKDLRHFLLSYIFEVSLPNWAFLMDWCRGIWPISMNRQGEKMLHFNSLPDSYTARLLGSSPSCVSTRPDSVLAGQEVYHFPDQTVCQCVTPPSVTEPRHAVNLKTNHHRTISDKVNSECLRRLCLDLLILQRRCCDC